MSLVVLITLAGLCPSFQQLKPEPASQNWSQFLGGPNRINSVSTPATSGSTLQFKELWRTELGPGYSGMIVSREKVAVMFADGGSDFVGALDASNGKELWRHKLEPTNIGQNGSLDGPLSTPAISNGTVFALSANAKLVALNLDDGKVKWEANLKSSYGMRKPRYGCASSPLVTEHHVIVTTSGRPGYTVLALDKETGKRAWNNGSSKVEYSSPSAATLAGTEQVVIMTDQSIYAVNAETGRQVWFIKEQPDPWGTAMPLSENRLLVPLNRGLALYECSKGRSGLVMKEIWVNPQFKSQYSWLAANDKSIFAAHRDGLMSVDPVTGRTHWSQRGNPSSCVLVGDTLFSVDQDTGTLQAVAAHVSGFSSRGTMGLFSGANHWALPAYAGGKLFVRSNDEFVCIGLEN